MTAASSQKREKPKTFVPGFVVYVSMYWRQPTQEEQSPPAKVKLLYESFPYAPCSDQAQSATML